MSIRLAAAGLAAAVLLSTLPAVAEDPSAMSCGQLWHRRNAILKAKGFCFTDARAARDFGNDGCTVHGLAHVQMTPDERQLMARIVLAEKINRCR